MENDTYKLEVYAVLSVTTPSEPFLQFQMTVKATGEKFGGTLTDDASRAHAAEMIAAYNPSA